MDSKIDFTAWARNLPVESIPALVQLAAVQSALAVRLMGSISDAADCSRALDNRPEPAESFVDAKEMARRLDVHESWVRTEQRAGRIPFVQIGRYIRFRPSEVAFALKNWRGDRTRL